MTTTTRTRRLIGGGLLLSMAAIALPGTTLAKHGDVRKTIDCSGPSTVKLKLGLRDGRIEAEGEVDQNRNGKTWDWAFKKDGVRFSHGSSTTHAPSGSFSVERTTSNPAGKDTIVFRATNPRTGEVCRVSLTI